MCPQYFCTVSRPPNDFNLISKTLRFSKQLLALCSSTRSSICRLNCCLKCLNCANTGPSTSFDNRTLHLNYHHSLHQPKSKWHEFTVSPSHTSHSIPHFPLEYCGLCTTILALLSGRMRSRWSSHISCPRASALRASGRLVLMAPIAPIAPVAPLPGGCQPPG